MQKENQVLELQEEVTRLSSSSRGGVEGVSLAKIAPRLELSFSPALQTDAKKERAERNRRWENLIAEIGQLKIKVSFSIRGSHWELTLSHHTTDHRPRKRRRGEEQADQVSQAIAGERLQSLPVDRRQRRLGGFSSLAS